MGEHAFNMLSNTDKASLTDEFIAKKEWFEDVAHQNTIALRLPPEVTCLGQRGGFLSIERLGSLCISITCGRHPLTRLFFRRQMKNFFEFPLSRTCQLVVEHMLECNRKGYQVSVSWHLPRTSPVIHSLTVFFFPQYVFLVGGFGTSPYLRERLAAELHPLRNDCTIITPRHAYVQTSPLSASFSSRLTANQRASCGPRMSIHAPAASAQGDGPGQPAVVPHKHRRRRAAEIRSRRALEGG